MKRGLPFSITGFYSLGSRAAVQQAMSRLAKAGEIERVTRGLYMRPKFLTSLPSIKIKVSAEQIAKSWGKEHGYNLVSQGEESAYRLGFQTQSPMQKVFWSNGPSRKFRVGQQVVEVRHASRQKLRWRNSSEGELLRGLLVTPPESLEVSDLKQAVERLSLSASEVQLTIKKLLNEPQLNAWHSRLSQLNEII